MFTEEGDGQAEAIRHGISKALILYYEEFKDALKRTGFLTVIRGSRNGEIREKGSETQAPVLQEISPWPSSVHSKRDGHVLPFLVS